MLHLIDSGFIGVAHFICAVQVQACDRKLLVLHGVPNLFRVGASKLSKYEEKRKGCVVMGIPVCRFKDKEASCMPYVAHHLLNIYQKGLRL